MSIDDRHPWAEEDPEGPMSKMGELLELERQARVARKALTFVSYDGALSISIGPGVDLKFPLRITFEDAETDLSVEDVRKLRSIIDVILEEED